MKVQKIEISEGITDKVGNKWKKRELKFEVDLDDIEGSDFDIVKEKSFILRETIQEVLK